LKLVAVEHGLFVNRTRRRYNLSKKLSKKKKKKKNK